MWESRHAASKPLSYAVQWHTVDFISRSLPLRGWVIYYCTVQGQMLHRYYTIEICARTNRFALLSKSVCVLGPKLFVSLAVSSEPVINPQQKYIWLQRMQIRWLKCIPVSVREYVWIIVLNGNSAYELTYSTDQQTSLILASASHCERVMYYVLFSVYHASLHLWIFNIDSVQFNFIYIIVMPNHNNNHLRELWHYDNTEKTYDPLRQWEGKTPV